METTTALETALAAWLAFLAQLGIDMSPYLLPPATETQIVAVEQEIGYRLPEDLRELYQIANGQADQSDMQFQQTETKSDSLPWAPLFGNYEFLSLEQAVELWRVQNEIYSDPMFKEDDFSWEVRSDDPVDKQGWNRFWFVFAGRHSNHYSVDTQPPQAGTSGQVVVHGSDEWELQVVASSVTELMQQAARLLDPLDTPRYHFSRLDDETLETLYFDMDWRKHFQSKQEIQEEHEAYERTQQDWLDRHPLFVQWQQEQLDLRQLRMEEFGAWLHARSYNNEQSEEIVNASTGDFMGMMGGAMAVGTTVVLMPQGVLDELQSGEAEEQDNLYMMQTVAMGLVTGSADESPAAIARRSEVRYLYTAVMMLFNSSPMMQQHASVPAEEQVRLISQFHREKQMIPQPLYNGISELIDELQSIPNGDSLYIGMNDDAMTGAEPIVEICFSENCQKISLLPYLSQ